MFTWGGMTNTTTTTSVQVGTYLQSTISARRSVLVIDTPQELRAAPGMFVIKFENTGVRQFGRLTGRTTYRDGFNCPTVERFDIDTVADEDGALWGDPGQRLLGTFFAYPTSIVR